MTPIQGVGLSRPGCRLITAIQRAIQEQLIISEGSTDRVAQRDGIDTVRNIPICICWDNSLVNP